MLLENIESYKLSRSIINNLTGIRSICIESIPFAQEADNKRHTCCCDGYCESRLDSRHVGHQNVGYLLGGEDRPELGSTSTKY